MPETKKKSGDNPDVAMPERLVSLDVYRGLIMITLAFNGFGLAATANNYIRNGDNSEFWRTIQYQFSHVEWVGCAYWDMIQPSFMFMVGAAMAFSYAKREKLGQSWLGMLCHALSRSLILIILGVFLTVSSRGANLSFMNVLTQIGLGYTFLFLLWRKPAWVQALAAVLILTGTWALYVSFPNGTIDPSVDHDDLGIKAAWAQDHLRGIASAWQKNANVGHTFDVWFLNLFPRSQPFVFNGGGYQTINFVPSLATMIFGLMCGELLKTSQRRWLNIVLLIVAGGVGFASGYALDFYGICPIVKRIWTPSWALYSTGICCWILAGLYLVIDVIGLKYWTFPITVVGMNSIAIYSMSQLFKDRVAQTWRSFFGGDFFNLLGELNEPAFRFCLVGLTFWLVCYWLYRQKIFLRI